MREATALAPATRPDLARDQRGAILVAGLFAAAFLFGSVYFVLGVGDAIEHRQTMQDAADSGAYTLAVLHARAMNAVALLNMVKLSVAATVTSLVAVAAGAAKTIAWIQASPARLAAFGAAIPLLAATQTRAVADRESIRADTDAVLRAADRAQETLRERLPELAEAQAGTAATAFGPPVERGAAAMRALPIRRGQPLALCTEAVPLARPPALNAFDASLPAPVQARARAEAEAALLPGCLGLGVAAMELEPGTRLGGERLQLRYYVLGGAQPGRGEQGVEVATWGREGGSVEGGAVSFAQAEYYFDGEGAAAQEDADELWSLGWRARFRRFRPDDLAGEIAAACRETGAARCADSAGPLGDIAARVAH